MNEYKLYIIRQTEDITNDTGWKPCKESTHELIRRFLGETISAANYEEATKIFLEKISTMHLMYKNQVSYYEYAIKLADKDLPDRVCRYMSIT